MNSRILPFFLVFIACLSCKSGPRYVEITGYAQGSAYSIKCSLPDRPGAQEEAHMLQNGVDSILGCIDRAVSGYNQESLLSRSNAGVDITDDGSAEYLIFSELRNYCDSIYTATGGVVDCRAAALFDIWGFGFKNGEMPSEDEIQKALEDRSRMNFNAVAQGYSADLVASYLAGQGVGNMLVNIGGEMLCSGVNPQGREWTIGIDAPFDGNMEPGKNLETVFKIPMGSRCGVVTSGNYRKFYVHDGKKYAHTIDPRTGRPVQHNLLSATVIAPTSALADAMATYCMVVGMDEAASFIESRKDLEGCLISSDSLWCSRNFRK